MQTRSDVRNGPQARVIAICADDYGVDTAVNDAIVDLASKERLTATSVLVDGAALEQAKQALSPLALDLGLHLNFTDAIGNLTAKDVMPLSTLIVRSHARLLSKEWVRAGVERQLDRFEALFGRGPDYVDGHLHIHQLPIIRDVLTEALEKRYGRGSLWIRDTRPSLSMQAHGPWLSRIKTWVIAHLGMATLVKRAKQRGWETNHGFAGVYDFTRPHPPFFDMFRDWCGHCESGALIMTHPSRKALPGDPIGQARVAEYETLNSDDLSQYLASQQIKVGRLSQLLSDLP